MSHYASSYTSTSSLYAHNNKGSLITGFRGTRNSFQTGYRSVQLTFAVRRLGRVPHFDMQTLAERRQRRFHLIQAGVVPEREQSVNVRFGYSDPARELGFR